MLLGISQFLFKVQQILLFIKMKQIRIIDKVYYAHLYIYNNKHVSKIILFKSVLFIIIFFSEINIVDNIKSFKVNIKFVQIDKAKISIHQISLRDVIYIFYCSSNRSCTNKYG